MKALLLLAILILPQRPLPPARQVELYRQGCDDCAQGLWYDGHAVGVIGWNGGSVPRGAQVMLKGRNFAGRSSLLMLRHSHYSDLGDLVYIVPVTWDDGFPFPVESARFYLPPFVTGHVYVRLFVEGRESNEVHFEVE